MKLFAVGMSLLFSQLSIGRSINSQDTSDHDSLKVIEKVYLHLDREAYYPGEDIWFKAYLVDTPERSLSNHSNSLHVEIISPSSQIIDSRIVRIEDGLGKGDFQLSDKLQSGLYRIRAYTNYMRNFSDQLFFNKVISIINPSDAVKAFSGSTDYIRNKLDISFYPEGGSLVDNVPSVVAFKAVDALGEPCNVSGAVYSSKGEIVTTYKSIHNGMGIFTLSPVPGIAYYAICKNHYGDSVKSEIPRSFSSGIVLNISGNKSSGLKVTVRTNKETLPLVLDYDLTLNISARGKLLKKADFRMKSSADCFIIPIDDLPDGIVMLSLSGPENIHLCERLVYIQNSENYNVSLELNKPVYNQRDSVSVRISLPSNSSEPQKAFLSLSATKNISENGPTRFHSTISSWFLLESDVIGPVDEPSYYFDSSNPNRLKDLDLLLLTQGWRDFKWKYKEIRYPAEAGFSISGRVRKLFADEPLLNTKVSIAIFKSRTPLIRIVPTDSSGRFYLEGIDITGNAKLILSATGDKGRLQGMLQLDSLRYLPAIVYDTIIPQGKSQKDGKTNLFGHITLNDTIIKDNLASYIQYAEIKNSIQKRYKLSDTINPGEVTITAERQETFESAESRSRHYLMATPDASLIVTPELHIYSNTYKLIRSKMGHSMGLIERPIFVIDGVKVSAEAFMSVPVSFIERIDVLNTRASMAIFGANQENPNHQILTADGVFSITTRTGPPLESNNTVFHSENVTFSGYNEPRIFYSPKHHSKLESDYKPDLRTTLFWEPDIEIENNKDIFLNYFNADNPSKVKVIVEGITSTGIPVTGTAEYEVK